MPSPAPTAVPAALLVLLLGATACTSDDPAERSGETAEDVAAAPLDPTEVEVGEVVGDVARERRRTAAQEVAQVVERWWAAAYDEPALPLARGDVGEDLFPGFTAGAAARARADRDVTTAAGLDERVEEVAVQRRRVVVDLLGRRGRPEAATARVLLVLAPRAGDEELRPVRRSGRLLLTRGPQGWRVFGYDLRKG